VHRPKKINPQRQTSRRKTSQYARQNIIRTDNKKRVGTGGSAAMKPIFYEFFSGGGMARAGLEPEWRCAFANDIDPKKGTSYLANWGDEEFHLGDIHDLTPVDLPPGKADLAWASFPCQDLSLAGNGEGLDGERSGAFWGFHDIIHALKVRRREPMLLVLENVGGAVTSKDGRDFEALCRALKNLGYVYGAMMLDAVHFVPQSRPRLFIVALRSNFDHAARNFVDGPSPIWTTDALKRGFARLRPDLRRAWRWWRLPSPPIRNVGLSDLIIDDPTDVEWHSMAETRRLLSLMSPGNLAKVKAAKQEGRRIVGTIYKRTRRDDAGNKIQRAEVRFDDISGCLRTPGGGSSRQTIIVVDRERVSTRLLSAREAARLMGLPDTYDLPLRYNDAYHLTGDGLAVPVVRFLSINLLMPMFYSTQAEKLIAAE
jgi:DNA (cytosine-5)-methyltransferase 1